jgi:hypothetical protein
MDPYLEVHWGDIHQTLITYARDQLQGYLPSDLRARVQERVFLEYPENGDQSRYPDIRVIEGGRKRGAKNKVAVPLVVEKPLVVRGPGTPVTEGYVEIIDTRTGRRVVTVIELLSPSNKKPGAGLKEHLKKQTECRRGRVNLVEIDLLRGGDRMLSVPWDFIRPSHRTPYQVCVYRATSRALGEVYRVPLRERLPVIGIPLRPTDADVPLDLQALIEQAYRNGGYDDDIDYEVEAEPPLNPDDACWADELLRAKGLRKGRAPKQPSRRKSRGRKTTS